MVVEFQSIGSLNEFERWVGFFNKENQLPVPSRFVHFRPNERRPVMLNTENAPFVADPPPFELSQLQASKSVTLTISFSLMKMRSENLIDFLWLKNYYICVISLTNLMDLRIRYLKRSRRSTWASNWANSASAPATCSHSRSKTTSRAWCPSRESTYSDLLQVGSAGAAPTSISPCASADSSLVVCSASVIVFLVFKLSLRSSDT